MAVDSTGVQPRSLDDYLVRLQQDFREALGAGLDVSPETPQGQLISLIAAALVTIDEDIVSVANGLWLNTASGIQLDALGSILQIFRKPGLPSKATLSVTGTDGTPIPLNSRAVTATGIEFRTTQPAIIGSASADAIPVQSIELGAVAAPAGSIHAFDPAIEGVESVTNEEDAILGRRSEDDTSYRYRYQLSVAKNTMGSRDTLVANVLGLDGVERCKVIENYGVDEVFPETYLEESNITIKSNSSMVIVQGGDIDEVAEAIYTYRTLGAELSGSTERTVRNVPVRFQPCHVIPIGVQIGIIPSSDFPFNGHQQIRQDIEIFLSELDIGESIDMQRLQGRVLDNTSGFSIGELDAGTIGRLEDHPGWALRQSSTLASRGDRLWDGSVSQDTGVRKTDLITLIPSGITITTLS